MSSISLYQTDRGDMELPGYDGNGYGFLVSSIRYTSASVDEPIFIAPRAMRVRSITARVEVAGTDASAVTAVVRKVPSGTALTSGTALHSGSINLKGTAATNQSLTLSTTDTDLFLSAGDAVCIDYTGTLTAAVGAVTVAFNPR
jgi:hypothetical protein